MKSRKQICQKLEQFYKEVKGKRQGKKMRLQVDQEFQQTKIKDLNKLNNVDMFSTSVRGGKAFAAKRKIRELKTRVAQLNGQKLGISSKKIIEMSTTNMNIQTSKKYGFSPEEVEKRALESKKFRTVYNMHRLEKMHKLSQRQDRYNKKKVLKKKKKIKRQSLHWTKSVHFGRKNTKKERTW